MPLNSLGCLAHACHYGELRTGVGASTVEGPAGGCVWWSLSSYHSGEDRLVKNAFVMECSSLVLRVNHCTGVDRCAIR